MKKIRTKLYQTFANSIIEAGSSDVTDYMFNKIYEFGMILDSVAVSKGIWLE
jgi:hypothetical protein